MRTDAILQEADVLAALRAVMDPDLKRDIVSLGFVKNVKICGGGVSVDVELTTPACPVKEKLRDECRERILALPGAESVSVNMTAAVRDPAARSGSSHPILAGVKNTVAIASGKGGVGKSSTAANLALALARTGARVGLLDADVYGPSIPTMFGAMEHPMQSPSHQLLPVTRHGVKLMSMGLLTTRETPIVWRGPMATKLIQQFLGAVDWGTLDYLLIDLPPGTGDVQLTLTQSCPLTGAVIVTTPQDVAMNIAMKGIRMFQQVNVPVLGMVENMSFFQCPHCSRRTEIFRHGRTEEICRNLGIPFLGEIPIDPEVVLAGDAGEPVVARRPGSPAAEAYAELAGRTAAQVSIVTIRTEETDVVPTEIKPAGERDLLVIWSDGHRSTYPFHRLRASCPCAACVDEWSGERRLVPASIPADVHPKEISPVGRYAVNFQWSDGHGSGVYAYKTLREWCDCPTCTGRESALERN